MKTRPGKKPGILRYGPERALHSEIDIIFTVITRLEVNKLTTEVEKIDPKPVHGDGQHQGYKRGNDKKAAA